MEFIFGQNFNEFSSTFKEISGEFKDKINKCSQEIKH